MHIWTLARAASHKKTLWGSQHLSFPHALAPWRLKLKVLAPLAHPRVLPAAVAKPLQKWVKIPKDIEGEITTTPLPLRDGSNKAITLGCF